MKDRKQLSGAIDRDGRSAGFSEGRTSQKSAEIDSEVILSQLFLSESHPQAEKPAHFPLPRLVTCAWRTSQENMAYVNSLPLPHTYKHLLQMLIV